MKPKSGMRMRMGNGKKKKKKKNDEVVGGWDLEVMVL